MALTGPSPDATFRYGGAASQKAELFLPEGNGPFPVVVLLHGGCWNSQYQGLTQLRALAAAFASQGIAVWNVEYRRVDEAGGGYPGTYRDVDAAIDLLVKTAPDVGIDTRRVVAVGHSAGAQLALWAAARARIPAGSPLAVTNPLPISHVVTLGGLLDLRRDADAIRDACGLDVAALTGTPDAARTDVYADTSPAAMLPTGIATVAINGAEDGVAPPELARRYAARATQAGDRVRTIVIPDAGHFDEVMPVPPVWPTLLATVRRALGMAQR
ncbi:alpha/beta hydrolase [Robbsia sp. Bb-Pol-6]|uniref:Alpha/beta hydrolase n=1 Tax=Robbsia betulipollinis TaxID=2981849 RepID=A0ABT3ZJF6_9BURK|nr:alpha/beta hydrolase [Robbsia betulipollinis]MCY0386118.1 alpha/beta hydrolase [Robbsia betulipollinis]